MVKVAVVLLALLVVAGVLGLVLVYTGAVAVEIASTPAGARVMLDGREAGVTPLTVAGLTVGDHTVELSRPGYLSESCIIAITRGMRLAFLVKREAVRHSFNLPSIPLGELVITSEPPGAQVYLDDDQAGTTPLRLPAVAPGAHRLRLVAPDYEPWLGAATIESGKTVEVQAPLRSRFISYYLSRIKENPKDLTAFSELIHHEVVVGDFASALKHIEAGLAAATQVAETAEKNRFADELVRIYVHQYSYPAETKEKPLRAPLRELVGKALNKQPNSPTLQRTYKQLTGT